MSESPQPTDAEQPAESPGDQPGDRSNDASGDQPDSRSVDPSADQPAGRSNDPGIVVAVVRSGGIAGISRRWRVEIAASDSTDAESWIALIERCPWDADTESSDGADRFMWSIRARTPHERRERELPDAAVSGPWRELVDAVRAASA